MPTLHPLSLRRCSADAAQSRERWGSKKKRVITRSHVGTVKLVHFNLESRNKYSFNARTTAQHSMHLPLQSVP